MRRTVLPLIVVLAFGVTPLVAVTSAVAQEAPAEADPGPRTMDEAADRVRTALTTDDAEALRHWVEQTDWDPWRLVDTLCRAGEHDLAAKFAAAGKTPRFEKLGAYVESRRGKTPATTSYETLEKAEALSSSDPAGALSLLKDLDASDDDVTSLRIATTRAFLRFAAERVVSQAEEFEQIAKRANEIGWPLMEVTAYRNGGYMYSRRNDLTGLERCVRGWLAAAKRSGDPRAEGDAVNQLAIVMFRTNRVDQGEPLLQRAIELYERCNHLAGLAGARINLGNHMRMTGRPAEARKLYERGVADAEQAGHARFRVNGLLNLAALQSDAGLHEAAIQSYEEIAELARELGNGPQEVRAHGIRAEGLGLLGRFDEALAALEVARTIADTLADANLSAETDLVLGRVLSDAGDAGGALAAFERCLEHSVATRNSTREGMVRTSLASLLTSLGRANDARGHLETAIRLFEHVGEPADRIDARVALAHLEASVGRFARSLQLYDEAVRMATQSAAERKVAAILQDVGSARLVLGDPQGALAALLEAEKVYEALDGQIGLAGVKGLLSTAHYRLGDDERAIEAAEEAVRLADAHGRPGGRSDARYRLATAVIVRDPARALELLTEMAEVAPAAAEGDAGARLGSMASALWALGRQDEALAHATEAREAAREEGSLRLELLSIEQLTDYADVSGRHDEVPALVRAGVELLPRVSGNLGASVGAAARERHTRFLRTGLSSAVVSGDGEFALFCIETMRASVLLEALGGREALSSVVLPEELLELERRARGAGVVAREAYEKARAARRLKELRAAKKAIEAADAELLAVVERIQIEARTAASLTHPQAATVDQLRAVLAPGDAIVTYADSPRGRVAVVLTPKELRVVSVAGDVSAFPWDDAESTDTDTDAVTASLRKVLAEPLGLGDGVTRVIVSPAASTAYVPFSVVFPDVQVLHVPSATTFLTLKRLDPGTSEGVLALGDPDYAGAPPSGGSANRAGAMGKLAPLPGTRIEVEAFGTRKLLGKDATEGGLLVALGEQARWRSIHLACHGLVDPEQPLLSSLAFTRDAGNDGFLTAAEILRADFSADLVALSACETARGKVTSAEGVVGLTRSFMVAGAPRVLCSLWKVDDAATSALMLRFYELWNPAEGDGLQPTEALRQAQAHVRAEPEWSHPYFWAAWQLWGLDE